MKKNVLYRILIIIIVVFFIFSISGCSLINSAFKLRDKIISESTQTTQEKASPMLKERQESNEDILVAFNEAISSIVEEVKPSVVSIRVTILQRDIFGNLAQGEGVGSGVIFNSDGYIITNNHVTEGASSITVTLYDGTEYQAILKGADKDTDISVIKIDAQNLKTAEFTTVEQVKVGEIAIAMGSPFGLHETVTQGVISAIGRDVAISYDSMPMVDLLQTDAAINPGNSGGPLLNSTGQVMGINTIIFSTSGSSSGIGFAIPSDTAVNIAEQIIKYGESKVPFIGIEMGSTDEVNVKGVYIAKVIKGSPAEKAGLKVGDIITEFNGKIIETPYELIAQMQRHNVNDEVTLTILRNGSTLEVIVVLGEK